MGALGQINLINASEYKKNCPIENRWDLEVSEDQAKQIAQAVKPGVINLRYVVEGEFIEEGSEKIWYGDNLGRIAEGLSQGKIQLHQDECPQPLSDRDWTDISMKDAKGWKDIFVKYVYLHDLSDKLLNQAKQNESKKLIDAGHIYPGQYVGLTEDLTVVVGDQLDAVVKCIRGEEVSEL